jgi:hypothetical protein
MAHTIILTPEQSALWEVGGWDSYRIEETIIEDLDRQNITEPTIITLDTGQVLFAIYRGRLQ